MIHYTFPSENYFPIGAKNGNSPLQKKPSERFTVAEYFAGIGLVRMGLEPLGWNVVFANDISAKKHEMYKAFFPDGKDHYLVGDIFKITPSQTPLATLATCSFPCIDLSLAGNMNGIDGQHSSAFWGFVKILNSQGETAPRLVLVENVPGWLYSNRGNDFRATVQALNKLGYACDVFILDALRFTPQSASARFSCWNETPKSQKQSRVHIQHPFSPQIIILETIEKNLVRTRFHGIC